MAGGDFKKGLFQVWINSGNWLVGKKGAKGKVKEGRLGKLGLVIFGGISLGLFLGKNNPFKGVKKFPGNIRKKISGIFSRIFTSLTKGPILRTKRFLNKRFEIPGEIIFPGGFFKI